MADELPSVDFAARLEIRRRAEFLLECERSRALQRYCLDRSRSDLVWWFGTFCWGYSPDRPTEEASPLLPWPYVVEILRSVQSGGLAVFDKSRWIGVTYAILGLYLHEWLFRAGVSLAFSSRTGADVDDGTEGSLAGKFLFMLSHLPSWMRPRLRDVHTPRVVLENLDNGSTVVGWKATPTAFHGPRYARIFVDEASRVACMRSMMTGVANASPNVVLVGTPDGRLGYFPELVHGEAGEVKTFDAFGDGYAAWKGWHHMRFHYSLDPRKTPEWVSAKRATMSAEHWAEQYEIDYEASTPGRIWPEWRRDLHCYSAAEWDELVREGWLEEAPIIEAWDVGIEMAVVWLVWLEPSDTVIAVDHRTWHDARPDKIAQDVAAARSEVAPQGWFVAPEVVAPGAAVPKMRRVGNPRGRKPELRVADPAVKNRRQVGDKRSWAVLLSEVGIELRSRGIVGRVPALQAKVRDMIADGRFMAAPRCTLRHNGFPSLVEAIEGYKHHVDPGGNTVWAAEKDDCAHLADALQYGVDWAGAPASLRSVRAGADGMREEVGSGRGRHGDG